MFSFNLPSDSFDTSLLTLTPRMVATSKLPKLRATRARLDLSTQGNQQDRNSSSPDVFTVDAILYSTVALQEASHEEIDEACRSEMSKEMDTTSRDDGCDPIRWGNSRGLTVLECLDEMKKEIIKIKADNTASDLKATALDLKATALDLKVNTMEDELNTMKLIHTEYLEVRNRFLSMAKRDQLGTASPKDYQIIRHGKVLVHTGDALCDAMLYKKRLRRDDETFQTLYGMAWSRVLSDYGMYSVRE